MGYIVDELRTYQAAARSDAGQSCVAVAERVACVPESVLARAISEIEHLRSLAGAVSQGQTFAQIRETAPVVLKAFDGA